MPLLDYRTSGLLGLLEGYYFYEAGLGCWTVKLMTSG